jgi:hypothetical protein
MVFGAIGVADVQCGGWEQGQTARLTGALLDHSIDHVHILKVNADTYLLTWNRRSEFDRPAKRAFVSRVITSSTKLWTIMALGQGMGRASVWAIRFSFRFSNQGL